MSYPRSGQPAYSYPPPQSTPSYYSATPPAPPPKPSSTEGRGPPLPPPPPNQGENEPLELDGGQNYQYQQQYQSQAPQQQANIPNIEPGWLPEGLREKTTTDLHDLLNNPELQAALLNNPDTTHPSIPASQAHLQPLLDSNIQLANNLTQLEADLTRKREQTQSRLLALRALEQQHRAKITETERALEQFSPMALYQRLSGSVQEQEQLIRSMEESWLEEEGTAGEREVGDFVRRVKEARKVGFLRSERKERWDEGRVGGWR